MWVVSIFFKTSRRKFTERISGYDRKDWEGCEPTAQETKTKLHEIRHTKKSLQGNKNNQQNERITYRRFINHMSEKELIFVLCEELKQFK